VGDGGVTLGIRGDEEGDERGDDEVSCWGASRPKDSMSSTKEGSVVIVKLREGGIMFDLERMAGMEARYIRRTWHRNAHGLLPSGLYTIISPTEHPPRKDQLSSPRRLPDLPATR
jgi:hypothetical protein